MSVRLKNSCGKKTYINVERGGSTLQTWVGSSTSEDMVTDDGDAIVITDEKHNAKIARAVVEPGIKEIEIVGDCTRMSSH